MQTLLDVAGATPASWWVLALMVIASLLALSFRAFAFALEEQIGSARRVALAHLGGAVAGVLFVLLTDAPAAARAWQQRLG